MRPLLRKYLSLLLSAFTVAACAHPGQFVWVQNYAAPARETHTARIAPGDLLSVQVWKADQMGSRQRVGEDGTVSLFFASGLHVAGLTTAQAADSIATRLDGVLLAPRVNVVIEESAVSSISVLGEVVRPGRFAVRDVPTVLTAISSAAGLTEFAHRDRIFVLRGGAQPVRIRFTYAQLMRGDDVSRGFRLEPGDAVIVE